MSRDFYIPFGENEEHAARLKQGLALMHPEFSAYVCNVCDGKGAYSQKYTAGCGHGYFQSMGPCDYCRGTGLCQGSGCYNPAPDSVREQVLNAAQAQLTHDGEPTEACIILVELGEIREIFQNKFAGQHRIFVSTKDC